MHTQQKQQQQQLSEGTTTGHNCSNKMGIVPPRAHQSMVFRRPSSQLVRSRQPNEPSLLLPM